jgi:membrane peptidoglycan carboxypeptidase
MIGIGRAFNEYVLQGGDIQGGSSITQQVVKNNLIEPERRLVGSEVGLDDYQRKLEELLLARQVPQTYSKEQILEWYLNTNFYGNLAYGIEAAARIYFDKPASQLTLAEARLLAAIPPIARRSTRSTTRTRPKHVRNWCWMRWCARG